MVLPMLSIVFWNGNIPLSVTTAFNSVTLLGMVIGQVAFGVLADRYGRKKMYGLELLVVIFATLGVALASKGAANSIHIIGWLVFWRLLLGFGIGGDYPLSAVITAEYVFWARTSCQKPTNSTAIPGSLRENVVLACWQPSSSCNPSDS